MSQQTAASTSLVRKVVLVLVSAAAGIFLAEVAARYLRPVLQPWAVAPALSAPGECGEIILALIE